MSFKIIRRCSCVLFLTSLAGCGPTKPADPPPEKNDFPASPARAFEGVTEFPYTASKTKQDLVLAGYKTLRKDMSIEAVSSILGIPDFSETYSPTDSSAVTGHKLTYYLFRKEKEKVNEVEDVFVMVLFSSKGKLEKVLPHNLERLQNRKEKDPSRHEDVTPPANPIKGQ